MINNAGYGVVGVLEEMPDVELRAIMDTNFFGTMAVLRAALPLLDEIDSWEAVGRATAFDGVNLAAR